MPSHDPLPPLPCYIVHVWAQTPQFPPSNDGAMPEPRPGHERNKIASLWKAILSLPLVAILGLWYTPWYQEPVMGATCRWAARQTNPHPLREVAANRDICFPKYLGITAPEAESTTDAFLGQASGANPASAAS